MKKLIVIILCLVMTLSLLACVGGNEGTTTQGTEAGATGAFSVGYAREEIKVNLGTNLSGYGNDSERKATMILDPLYVTCVAMRDAEGNMALLLTHDSIRTEVSVARSVRRKLAKELEIPEENIFFTSTHCHSTPDSKNVDTVDCAVAAGLAAVEDLKPATMQIGTGKTNNLNFVRHYIMDDGSIVGDNYGDPTGKTYAKHETDADNELRLIRFTREGGKDVVMMNWQVHPHMTGGFQKTDVSADIVGACRMTVEEEMDCHFAYFSGASGNLDPTSRIASENVVNGYVEHGKALGTAAITALNNNMKDVETGLIKATTNTYAGKVRKDSAEVIAAATLFEEAYENGATATEALKASGGLVNSIFAVNGIKTRAGLGETKDIEMYALSIGNVSFAGVEYEMFDTNGQELREGVKDSYDMTFILCYCNGKNGYIPSAIAYANGCYEMDNGYFEAGTGELLVTEYINLLESLK